MICFCFKHIHTNPFAFFPNSCGFSSTSKAIFVIILDWIQQSHSGEHLRVRDLFLHPPSRQQYFWLLCWRKREETVIPLLPTEASLLTWLLLHTSATTTLGKFFWKPKKMIGEGTEYGKDMWSLHPQAIRILQDSRFLHNSCTTLTYVILRTLLAFEFIFLPNQIHSKFLLVARRKIFTLLLVHPDSSSATDSLKSLYRLVLFSLPPSYLTILLTDFEKVVFSFMSSWWCFPRASALLNMLPSFTCTIFPTTSLWLKTIVPLLLLCSISSLSHYHILHDYHCKLNCIKTKYLGLPPSLPTPFLLTLMVFLFTPPLKLII